MFTEPLFFISENGLNIHIVLKFAQLYLLFNFKCQSMSFGNDASEDSQRKLFTRLSTLILEKRKGVIRLDWRMKIWKIWGDFYLDKALIGLISHILRKKTLWPSDKWVRFLQTKLTRCDKLVFSPTRSYILFPSSATRIVISRITQPVLDSTPYSHPNFGVPHVHFVAKQSRADYVVLLNPQLFNDSIIYSGRRRNRQPCWWF